MFWQKHHELIKMFHSLAPHICLSYPQLTDKMKNQLKRGELFVANQMVLASKVGTEIRPSFLHSSSCDELKFHLFLIGIAGGSNRIWQRRSSETVLENMLSEHHFLIVIQTKSVPVCSPSSAVSETVHIILLLTGKLPSTTWKQTFTLCVIICH